MSLDDEGSGKSDFPGFEWLPVGAPAIFCELTGPTLRALTASNQNNNLVGTVTGSHAQPTISTGT